MKKKKEEKEEKINFLQKIFTTFTEHWLPRKKLTVVTLLWVMSILGFNTRSNFTKYQVKSSREEIIELALEAKKLADKVNHHTQLNNHLFSKKGQKKLAQSFEKIKQSSVFLMEASFTLNRELFLQADEDVSLQ